MSVVSGWVVLIDLTDINDWFLCAGGRPLLGRRMPWHVRVSPYLPEPVSNRNPLHLVEAHLVAPAIVELRRARRGVVRHRRSVFQRAAVLEVRGDAGRAERVIAYNGL